MNPVGSIRLRVISGPHLGAEITLPAGEYLVGSDDSCDIILVDGVLAPRHALVQVFSAQEETAEPGANIKPVDDTGLIDGASIAPDGAPWPPGSPCLLGSTELVWLPAEAVAEAWQKLFARLAAPVPRDAGPKLEAAHDNPETKQAPLELADANSVASTTTSPQTRSRVMGKILRALVVLLCLGSLAISYEFSARPGGTTQDELSEILNKNDFSSLIVTREAGVLTVRGDVANDEERARLVRLAQSLQSPVQLSVHVHSDRIDAIAFAFNSLGIFPEIRKNPEGGGHQVRGYISSKHVEDTAFTAVGENFSIDARPVLSRIIVHADDVGRTLRPLLAKAETDLVSTDFRPGLVIFSGELTEDQCGTLEAAMAEVQHTLGVPVPFRIVVAAQAPLPARGVEIGMKEAASRTTIPTPAPGIEGLQVTGVTLSPMRFISLNTGDRVFEGGLLPTGHTLENIDDKELKLRKDGVVTIYKLRGANE